MAIITPNLTVVSLADSTTGFSGTSGGLDTEVYKQAVSIGSDGSYTYQTGKNSLENCTFTPATNINMTASYTVPHLYWTWRCDVFPFCELLNTGSTNSGAMVRVTDGSGNYVQWHLDGSDTWDGRWKEFVLDLTNTTNVHSSSGTLSLADVDVITFYTDNSNSGNIRIIDNTWLDSIRYGEGLTLNSTTTESVSFLDIAFYDALTANYYGVIQETDGVLFSQGLLKLGLDAYTTNFVSDGETVYFKDRIVSSSHYGILGINGGGSPTDIDIKSLVCKTVGLSGAELDFSDASLNSLSIIGSTFIDMGSISLGLGTVSTTGFSGCGISTISNCAVSDTSWKTSDTVTISGTTTLDTCLFDNATGASSVITADLEDLTNCDFISDGSNHAIELTALGNGTMNWNNYLTGYAGSDGSTGNEGIYVNVGTGTLTINVDAGYTIPYIRTAGAVVTVVAGQVTTTITVKNSDGDPIIGARVYAITETTGAYPAPPLADGTLIFNTITDVNGQVSDTRSLASPQPIGGWSRDSTAPAPYYKQTPFNEVIDNGTGLNLNILLILDE